MVPGMGHEGMSISEIEQATLLEENKKIHRAPTSTQQAAQSLLSSYFSRRFMSGCAFLFPLVVTVYVTWWFLEFFDTFFSPLYTHILGIHVFGLGFLTSMLFIFATGVFMGSWLGSTFLNLGEFIIRRLPFVKHIYSAAKQVSAAISPDNGDSASFRECVVIRHPRNGSYAFGFVTGQTRLSVPAAQVAALAGGLAAGKGGLVPPSSSSPAAAFATGPAASAAAPPPAPAPLVDLELFSIYVPTNHIYVGDIYLLPASDIIRNGLSVREGIEIVVSLGMAVPQRIRREGEQ